MNYLPNRRRDIEEGGIGPIERKRQRKPWVYLSDHEEVIRDRDGYKVAFICMTIVCGLMLFGIIAYIIHVTV